MNFLRNDADYNSVCLNIRIGSQQMLQILLLLAEADLADFA